MQVPGSGYRANVRSFPAKLPGIEYGKEDQVRTVRSNATIAIFGRRPKVGLACVGLPIAVSPTTTDGLYVMFFCHQLIKKLDMRSKE